MQMRPGPIVRWMLGLVLLIPGSQGESAYRLLGPADFDGLAARVEFEPGDFLLFPNGAWENVTVRFRGRGTREKPITLRPLNPGMFILRGRSTLIVEGEWLVVEGLRIENTLDSHSRVVLQGSHHRLTLCRVDGPAPTGTVYVDGRGHRIDDCEFPGAASLEAVVTLEKAGDREALPIYEGNRFGPSLNPAEIR